jgi:DNA-binding response OmpR family regulator
VHALIVGRPSLADDPGRRMRQDSSSPAHTPRVARRQQRPILVVDDDRSILETMTDLLQGEGFEVLTAVDGLDALEVMRRSSASFILLDMRMPRMDGWQFAQTVRERGWRIPIIVMTAASDAQRWAKEIGADAYIAKPFDIEELLALVNRFAHRGQTN